ncbi:MAG: oligopeptide:H+ symporter [Planctomycetota bacterium]
MTSTSPQGAHAPVEPAGNGAPNTGFFGHPKGLQTLFFTEMWERFSFYGMKAILLLFMVEAVSKGGLGFAPSKAGPIFALYTSMAYLATVPGGWLADNFIGARRSVFVGGVLIMIGHILLAMHGMSFFYGGLAFVVLGTGLLKPCISKIVGDLYTEGDARRDAGFSIFYMGINLGAWSAPIVCGWLAQHDKFKSLLEGWGMDPLNSWHWGFAAAAVGMFFGLMQYMLSGRHLGEAGLYPAPPRDEADAKQRKRTLGIGLAGVALVGVVAAGYSTTARSLEAPEWAVVPDREYRLVGFAGQEELPYEAGEAVDAKTIRVSLGEAVLDPIQAAVAGGADSGQLEGLSIKLGSRTIDRITWRAEVVQAYAITGQVDGAATVYADGMNAKVLAKELGDDRMAAVEAALAGGATGGALEGASFKVGGLDQKAIQGGYTALMLLLIFGLFGNLLFRGDWTRAERARLVTIFVLFCGAAVFWGVFEQAGSTLTLFAQRSTQNSLFGSSFPASWWQSVNAFMIILLSPVFAWIWIKLGGRAPSDPAKFAIGLFFAGLGFFVLVGGAMGSGGWVRVSPLWLLSVYFLHTVGELCLSPVGLSSMTKLAPARVASLMMGVWFLASSVGNFISGSVAGFYEEFALPQLFGYVALGAGVMSFVMFLLVGPIKRMLANSVTA